MPRLFFSHYIYLIFCFVFFDLNIKKKTKNEKKKRWVSTFCHTFPIHTNGNVVFRWNRKDSIRNTFHLTPKSTGSQMKIREGRNVLGWYSPIPIRRMECDGVHGNPAESIHVHRNYWSCDKPNLRLVQYKPDMPRSQSHEGKQLVSRANDLKVQLFYQAFKQNSALRQQMQYA